MSSRYNFINKKKYNKNIKEDSAKEKIAKIKIKEFIKQSKNRVRMRKKPISNSMINIFYDSPQKFFAQYKKSIKYSSYFDICGNSIFMHYFYILYEKHKLNTKKIAKNNLSKNKILLNINVYENNIDAFLKEHKDSLVIQDLCFETPLHKIAKLHDKIFFLKIFEKLNILGLLNEKLISIKNIKNETCCDYIFDEIKNKYKYFISNKEDEYNLFKNFVSNIINIYYYSIFEPLTTEIKIILINFLLKNNYDIVKKQSFDNLYSNIDKILKIERILNICEYIYNPYCSGINYLNILFNLCKTNEDFNKLQNLVSQIQNRKETKIITNFNNNNNDNNFDLLSINELCILNHINYSFVKMNSSKVKGKYEINYCIQLIKNNFKQIINNKNDTQIINIIQNLFHLYNWRPFEDYIQKKDEKKIIPHRGGLINNLLLNTYLNFDKKEEILSILNETTHGIVYKELDEYFSIYTFFKYIHNSKKKITQLYKENKYIYKVINDFNLVGNIYEYLIYLCDNYDKDSLDKYIELLNNFVTNGNPILINCYKSKYNLSINYIKQIFNIIKNYKMENYNGKYEYLIMMEDFSFEFILSDKKLCEYCLLDIFQRNKEDFLALKIVFSFKYDFCEFIDSYQEQIINLISIYNKEFSLYLLSLETLEKNNNKALENKLIIILANLFLKNKELFCFYNEYIRKKNYSKFCFLFNESSNNFKYNISFLITICIKNLLTNWDKPIDYLQIFNYLEKIILQCCQFLIISMKTRIHKIKVINFFFDDFLFLINPEMRKKLEFYKNICYDNIINCEDDNSYEEYEDNSDENEDVYKDEDENKDKNKDKNKNKDEYFYSGFWKEIDNYAKDNKFYYSKNYYLKRRRYYYDEISLKKSQERERNRIKIYKMRANKKYYFIQKDQKIKEYFCFIMMLINIKIKYGDFNPELLFNICKEFNLFMDVFFNYIDISHENLKKKEIIQNFLLIKYSNEDSFDIKFKNYLSHNFSDLKQVNHSFIINFFTNINKKFDEMKIREYNSLIIPSFKLNNIPEKNNYFVNLLIEGIINKKIYFLNFLIEDYKIITDNEIEKIIRLIKFISKKCYDKLKKINLYTNKYNFFFINQYINENEKYNIFMNLYKFLIYLKKLNITLFNLLSNNFFFIGETISLFLDVYFNIIEKYYPIKKMKKEIDYINNEIQEFIVSFYKFYKDKEETKRTKIYQSIDYFFILLLKSFYNKISILNEKNDIYQEYNLLQEITKFIFEKNINKISIYNKFSGSNEYNENEDIIKIHFFIHNYDDYTIYQFKENIMLRNNIMEIIIEKIPDKFIEISEFFRKYNGSNNFISEINLLIKNNSEITFPYILNIYSLINSPEFLTTEKYKLRDFYKPFFSLKQLKYIMNNFIIRRIIILIKNINNIHEEINLNEQDLFKDKKICLKLLNYSFTKEKMDYIINKINMLYCEDNYENLFIEILKENIINKDIFDFVFNSLTEMQIKDLFENNKEIIIKAIYGYIEINGYYFIEILLNNLEKYTIDKKFIKHLIFPPKNTDEFNEMIKYLNEKIFFQISNSENSENMDENKEEEEKRRIEQEIKKNKIRKKKKKTKKEEEEKKEKEERKKKKKK